jgi:predicted ATPase
MGQIYCAFDRLRQVQVALKRLPAKPSSKGATEQFDLNIALTREFQILASLRHPNIIHVLNYGFDKNSAPYLTMDLLESPQTICEAAYKRSLSYKMTLLIQMLQALVYLHRRNILHLDLKPENVLVVDDKVKVVDFGLANARDYQRESFVGTLSYSAPEVLQEKMPTPATDLYAVGVLAFEMISEQLLYTASQDSIYKLISHILTVEPDWTILVHPLARSQWGERLLPIIRKLLEKNPDVRYQDAAQVITDLAQASDLSFSVETTATRESFLKAAKFIGREEELEKLRTALDHTLQGEGGTWMVCGESGVGKTRLLEEAQISAHVSGALVVHGQADVTNVSYKIWQEPIRHLLFNMEINDADLGVLGTIIPDIKDKEGNTPQPAAKLSNPAEAQGRLAATISRVFQGQNRPVVLIMEDLQWAQRESLMLLERAIALTKDLPLLILGSYRLDEYIPEELKHIDDVNTITLERFTSQEVEALAVSMAGSITVDVRQFLEDETEGNAFFMVEAVRALAEEAGELNKIEDLALPKHIFTGGVQRIIKRKLARIPESHYPLLSIAAVIGRELNLDVLHAAAPEEDLEHWLYICVEAAVLEVVEGRWRFAHDKIREGLLYDLNYQEFLIAHRAAAEAMEQVYANKLALYAAPLALHWHAVGDRHKKLKYVFMAGKYAYSISDNVNAIDYFEQAQALLYELRPPNWHQRHSDISIRMAQTYIHLSEDEEAKELLESAIQTGYDLQESALVARALVIKGRVALAEGDYEEAGACLSKSLETFRSTGDKQGEGDTLTSLGELASYQGNPKRAQIYLDKSLGIFQKTDNKVGKAHALAALGVLATMQGEFDKADHYLQLSLSFNDEVGNQVRSAGILMQLGMVSHYQGNEDESIDYLAESLQLFRRLGERSGIAACLNNLGYIEMLTESYKYARSHLRESLEISTDLQDRWAIANTLTNLAHIALKLGDRELAHQHFLEALKVAWNIGAIPNVVEILVGIAELFLLYDQKENLSDLLDLSLHHPAADVEVKERAQSLLSQLENESPEKNISTSAERAEEQDLSEIVEGLLALHGST